MVRCLRGDSKTNGPRWTPLPWTPDTPQWVAIDAALPPDHLARNIDHMVDM
jgi:hypothetical protein